jgi:hypothetical protein
LSTPALIVHSSRSTHHLYNERALRVAPSIDHRF